MKLYHYTTLKVLRKILETHEVWFTDFRFVNDTQEYKFASRIVGNTLDKFNFQEKIELLRQLPNCTENGLRGFQDLITNFKRDLFPKDFRPYEADYKHYIFSLSCKKDSLTHWRGYGDGEICIEFEAEKLKEVAGRELIKVDYKTGRETDARLPGRVNIFLDDVIRQFQEKGFIDPETRAIGSHDLLGFFYKDLKPISIKHIGFKDEHEWRLVREYSLRHKVDTMFFDEGRYPKPRARVRVSSSTIQLSDVVTSVVIGPGLDKEQAINSIDALKLAFQLQFEVLCSEVPYLDYKHN